jgi:hypothetical protein
MDAQSRYDKVVDDLLVQHGDVEKAQMMGMPTLKRNGKLVAGFAPSSGGMAFKLTDESAREAALAIEGARLFDPSERGRPMKEWVEVPVKHADRWPELARQAFASV